MKEEDGFKNPYYGMNREQRRAMKFGKAKRGSKTTRERLSRTNTTPIQQQVSITRTQPK